MREMDLIPADYRTLQLSRKMLTIFAAVVLTLVLSALIGRLFLGLRIDSVQREISQLTAESESLREHQTVIDGLEKERVNVNRELAFVEMLQQGGQASTAFQLFENTLEDSVWLTDWGYQANDLINAAEGQEQATGSAIKNVNEDGSLGAIILARGQASNHAALTRLVENLMAQKTVQDVRVLRSAMVDPQRGIVSFELEIN